MPIKDEVNDCLRPSNTIDTIFRAPVFRFDDLIEKRCSDSCDHAVKVTPHNKWQQTSRKVVTSMGPPGTWIFNPEISAFPIPYLTGQFFHRTVLLIPLGSNAVGKQFFLPSSAVFLRVSVWKFLHARQQATRGRSKSYLQIRICNSHNRNVKYQ